MKFSRTGERSPVSRAFFGKPRQPKPAVENSSGLFRLEARDRFYLIPHLRAGYQVA